MATDPLVLIVDDDKDLLEVWRRGMQGSPFRFQFAGTSEDALAVVSKEHPDIVVADYHMPGPVDGVRLLEQIRQLRPEAAQVLLTGSPPVSLERLDRVRVLLKPCTFAELQAALLAAQAERA